MISYHKCDMWRAGTLIAGALPHDVLHRDSDGAGDRAHGRASFHQEACASGGEDAGEAPTSH